MELPFPISQTAGRHLPEHPSPLMFPMTGKLVVSGYARVHRQFSSLLFTFTTRAVPNVISPMKQHARLDHAMVVLSATVLAHHLYPSLNGHWAIPAILIGMTFLSSTEPTSPLLSPTTLIVLRLLAPLTSIPVCFLLSILDAFQECSSMYLIATDCPSELVGSNGAGCNSACSANLDGTPEDSANCCTGSHGTPETCPPSGVEYYDYFKNAVSLVLPLCIYRFVFNICMISAPTHLRLPMMNHLEALLSFCALSPLLPISPSRSALKMFLSQLFRIVVSLCMNQIP